MTVTFSPLVSDESGLTASEGPEGVFDAVGSAFVDVPEPAVGVSVGAAGAPGVEDEAAPRRADECDEVAAATAVPQAVAAGPGVEFKVAGAGDAPCGVLGGTDGVTIGVVGTVMGMAGGGTVTEGTGTGIVGAG